MKKHRFTLRSCSFGILLAIWLCNSVTCWFIAYTTTSGHSSVRFWSWLIEQWLFSCDSFFLVGYPGHWYIVMSWNLMISWHRLSYGTRFLLYLFTTGVSMTKVLGWAPILHYSQRLHASVLNSHVYRGTRIFKSLGLLLALILPCFHIHFIR